VLRNLVAMSTGGLMPHLVLLLDLEPEAGLARARARTHDTAGSESWSRFEAEELAFHAKVRKGFLELAAEEPQTFVIIDAAQPKEAVFGAAVRALELRLPT
jgi:dTMP kinase